MFVCPAIKNWYTLVRLICFQLVAVHFDVVCSLHGVPVQASLSLHCRKVKMITVV